MSNSPFRRHQQKVMAELEAKAKRDAIEKNEPKAAELSASDYSEFEVLKHSLKTDVAALKNLPRGPERDALRDNTMLERYMQHVAAYLAKGEVYANEVLTQVMVWLFDAGRIDDALEYAKAAIAQSQKMPAEFKRSVQDFVADSVLAWAESEAKNGNSYEPFFSEVFDALEEWQVAAVVQMKFNKFAGTQAFDNGELERAAVLLNKAESLSDAKNPAQVKTLLNKVNKALENK